MSAPTITSKEFPLLYGFLRQAEAKFWSNEPCCGGRMPNFTTYASLDVLPQDLTTRPEVLRELRALSPQFAWLTEELAAEPRYKEHPTMKGVIFDRQGTNHINVVIPLAYDIMAKQLQSDRRIAKEDKKRMRTASRSLRPKKHYALIITWRGKKHTWRIW